MINEDRSAPVHRDPIPSARCARWAADRAAVAWYPDAVIDAAAIAPATIRPLRREEYDRMIEMGAFTDEKIELLEGMPVTDLALRVADFMKAAPKRR